MASTDPEALDLFSDLKAQIAEQDEKVAAANERVESQIEKMEEMEDMILALVGAMKELEDSVALRTPLRDHGGADTGSGDLSSALDVAVASRPLSGSSSQGTIDNTPIYGLMFGYLWKLSSGRGSISSKRHWSKRWFVVRGDGQVYYYKSMRDSTDEKVKPSVLDLRGYTLSPATEDKGKPFAFKAVSPEVRTRSFLFAPDTPTSAARAKWLDAFHQAQEARDAGGRAPSPSSSKGHRRSSTASMASVGSDSGRVSAISVDASPVKADHSPVSRSTSAEEMLTDAVTRASHSGWLQARVGANVWEPRFCCLLAEEKQFVQMKSSDPPVPVERDGQIVLQGAMIDIVMEEDADDRERVLSIQVGDNPAVLFYAETDDDYGSWFSKLNNLAQT
eukprot:m.361253 g.361253  ORF g.361253 m.361253 type:complete len:391 (-) comp20778_c2_seq2:95-1267(-)